MRGLAAEVDEVASPPPIGPGQGESFAGGGRDRVGIPGLGGGVDHSHDVGDVPEGERSTGHLQLAAEHATEFRPATALRQCGRSRLRTGGRRVTPGCHPPGRCAGRPRPLLPGRR